MAKCRVAPVKSKLEIPKLELQGAVPGSRILNTILSETRMKFERIYIFTDSMIVLAWIKNGSRSYKPFVSCRVSEIIMKTNPSDWRYCSTEQNVCDDITRGLSVDQLSGRYRQGPDFLTHPESEWPQMIGRQTPEDDNIIENEVRKEKIFVLTTAVQAKLSPLESMSK